MSLTTHITKDRYYVLHKVYFLSNTSVFRFLKRVLCLVISVWFLSAKHHIFKTNVWLALPESDVNVVPNLIFGYMTFHNISLLTISQK